MTKATPFDIASSSLHTKSASLRAAADALIVPDDELVTVQPADEMDMATFRLHVRMRHPLVANEFLTHHNLDHKTNRELDHVHEI